MPSLLPIGHKNMTDFFIGNIQETDDKGVLSVNDNCWISMSVLEFHCSCAKLWGESCIFLFPLSFSFKFLSQYLPSHGLHECPLHSQFSFIVRSPSFQHPTELKSPLICDPRYITSPTTSSPYSSLFSQLLSWNKVV